MERNKPRGTTIPTTTQLAIIQATPYCNIDCNYCYLADRSSARRIDTETLSKIAERLFESPFVGDEITVVWHAGEPLVAPVAFYEEAYAIFQRSNVNNVRIVFSFQTNATLVNANWCDFFVKIGARVGVSIDGPQRLHDLHRVDRRGRGTFARTLRGLKMLQQAGLRPTVIAVLTEEALRYPAEVWSFFVENGVELVGFNPEEAEGINLSSSLHNPTAEAAYGAFLGQILSMGVGIPEAPRLREYESTLQVIRSVDNRVHAHDNVPMAIVSFDCDGNISTFSPELLTSEHAPYGSFVFGNVFSHSLEDVLRDTRFLDVNRDIQRGVDECRATCDYYMFCGGGSPSNKIVENGALASTETGSCRLRIKITAGAVVEHIENAVHARETANNSSGPTG